MEFLKDKVENQIATDAEKNELLFILNKKGKMSDKFYNEYQRAI